MKKIIIGLIAFLSFAQSFGQSAGNDTAQYIYYRFTYGNALDRYWAKHVLLIPTDTIYSKDGVALKGGVFYVGDGIKWSQVAGSGADSSVFATITRLADSSMALRGLISTGYLKKVDSTQAFGYVPRNQVEALIDPKLDSIRRSNDSTYEYYSNNTRRLASTDSIGDVVTRRIIGPVDTPGVAKRNDGGSIVKLMDGTYLSAWSGFPGPNTGDVAASVIYGAKSSDGVHWGAKYIIMPVIAGLNSSTPSLKVRSNGDVVLVFNIKYNTVQLTSTLAWALSTNNGTSFTFQDSILKSQANYFYTKSDCLESSPGSGRWFLPYGQITNRGSSFFIGKFAYSDDQGDTWTISAQKFVSPDSIVNEPGIYISPRTPKTATPGEFVRFYYSNQTKSQIYEYQSIDNGGTWSSSFNPSGLQSPYAQPAIKVFDNSLRGIAIVNTVTGSPTQAGSRRSLSIMATGQEGHPNDIGNALTLGHQWRDMGPLVYADSGYTVFEPCILIDSAKNCALIGISKFDSAFTVASWEVVKVPLWRLRGPTQQTYSEINIKPSGLEFEANQGFFNLWNDLYGYADNHVSVKTLSSSSGDANFYFEVKNHNNGTAAGTGFVVTPGSDQNTAYYSAALFVRAAVSNMSMFKAYNSNIGTVFDIGPNGTTAIGGINRTANAWLQLSAGTTSVASMIFTSGPLRTTKASGQIGFENGLLYLDSSASVRDTFAMRGWVRNYIASLGSLGASYYQTIQSNVSSQTQRAKLNFSSHFTLTDNNGNSSTDVDLTSVTTQSPNDNSTNPASTAYVDAAVAGAIGSPGFQGPLHIVNDVDYTVASGVENVIYHNTLTAGRTCTLPDATTNTNRHIRIFLKNPGGNQLNIASVSNIYMTSTSASTSVPVTVAGYTMDFQSDGIDWYLLGTPSH